MATQIEEPSQIDDEIRVAIEGLLAAVLRTIGDDVVVPMEALAEDYSNHVIVVEHHEQVDAVTVRLVRADEV